MTTREADEEPIVQVMLEGQLTPMMIDSGATYTCVQPQYALHLPMTGTFIKTVGFSGKTQLTQCTAPVQLRMGNKGIVLLVLLSKGTPINLLGRDALLKLELKLECTRNGLSVERAGAQLIVREDKAANVFWIGDIADQIQETWEKWKKGVQAILSRAVMPKSELHCTVIFDITQNRELEERWHLEACTHVIIGKQGAALQVKWNTFLEKWYRIPEAAPHVPLLVNKGYQSKDLGPLVKSAETVTVWRKITPEVWISEDNNCIKIMVSVDMVGTVREVEITPQPHMPLLGKEKGQQKDRRLDELPSILWSQHDTDVGKITTASPVEIRVKKGAIPPRRPQYPLRPEAEEGQCKGCLKYECLKEQTVHAIPRCCRS
ncbi:E3 ubiquitin-protein ligase Siah1 isoform X1 [Hypanus sabinus]|uniref:E3 ubiquitin-protein ligase Siah1 isoform X1 n=1 Tax=Hypanus sabinus TaxID=79690 RepID=UPI0028C3E8F8|nr:E3 ubiquitin-protein ligase Siah1 isoform X1 [Hypanus sabinus]XP_059848894.1 E3 ubiquitin-protein ligase Siah1 isoform X1 [Hypanus sabinus]XP_059848895.1 E3 ubiquitin-protein ligase Siah1 isoform X1 [Hypanus sabinus]XP_059848896.1 E3 ubiquitin-protein ligase Siah1 isoform X1 [Hypanus sabinus]XP_059848897.1 E3 ubiquitin-protein ligase Siah1 isoform X1 [Hypanus sabinus]